MINPIPKASTARPPYTVTHKCMEVSRRSVFHNGEPFITRLLLNFIFLHWLLNLEAFIFARFIEKNIETMTEYPYPW